MTSCQSPVLTVKPEAPVESASKNESLSLAFVGDVIIHERLRKREEKTHEGYRAIWSDIQKYIKKADLAYANLEGPVSPEFGGVSGFPKFNFPEKIISSLKESGFSVVSTANNHALDRGPRGVRKTIENLKKYKLGYTGTISSETALSARKEYWWHLTPIHKKYVAWLSCTEMTNGIHDKEKQVLYCFKDMEKIKELINRLKKSKDVAAIILMPHWGEEEKFEIESYRKRWAHIMLNLGASAIVGSHPHVVQQIESFVTEDQRQTFIAYSLGNFVSNQPWIPNKASMIFFLKFRIDAEAHDFVLEDAKYIPLWMKRTAEIDGTSKYRLGAIFDDKKVPKEAVDIWANETGEERRLRSPAEVDSFFKKER